MNQLFQGSGVALVTPFTKDGINELVLRRLVEYQIQGGSAALVPCGSTGEAATLTPAEQARVIQVTVDQAEGRVPVVAGVGGSGTASVADLARGARDAGADAILLSPPPYNKPTQKGIIAHYRAVMSAADLPTIVYNVPSRTACNIAPETVEEIAEDDRVSGVKEASGDIAQMSELCRLLADRVAIYSGNDDQVVPLMSLGGRGVISVLANIAPRRVADMVDHYLAGRTEKARRAQFDLLPLARLLFREPNPIPIKAAVGLLGFDAGPVRLPLTEVGDETLGMMASMMKEMGIELEQTGEASVNA